MDETRKSVPAQIKASMATFLRSDAAFSTMLPFVQYQQHVKELKGTLEYNIEAHEWSTFHTE
jgi:hypothetical protein